ncbi:hypothetical protein ACHAWF_011504, partial [Thalassiosira exigua]
VAPEAADDERYYRPFRHRDGGGGGGGGGGAAAGKEGKVGKEQGGEKGGKSSRLEGEEEFDAAEGGRPADLLAALLDGPARPRDDDDNNGSDGDIARVMEEAAAKSRRARSLTEHLAAKRAGGSDSKRSASGGVSKDEDPYVAATNAHAEAAMAFRGAYRALLGLGDDGDNGNGNGDNGNDDNNNNDRTRPIAPSGAAAPVPGSELARSALLLARSHARTARSLGAMGERWNLGRVDAATGRMRSRADASSSPSSSAAPSIAGGANEREGKDRTKDGRRRSDDAASSAAADDGGGVPAAAPDVGERDGDAPGGEVAQHERLRMAVRGALDPTNREDDITDSVFLSRSTLSGTTGASVLNAPRNRPRRLGPGAPKANAKAEDRPAGGTDGAAADAGPNPVDDLMKLEKELRCMDMALEMGNSVASLGAAAAAANGGGGGVGGGGASFCVVPPGSSYMSTSTMWASGVLGAMGGGKGPQQPGAKATHPRPTNATNPRARANHLRNFAGGGGTKPPGGSHAPQPSSAQSPPKSAAGAQPQQQPPSQQQGLQTAPHAGLDQSWWGGGHGSILASAATTAAAGSHRLPPASPRGPGTNGVRADGRPVGGDGEQRQQQRQRSSSTNAQQLMQLMDSLHRLGNENAQLMREVEDARAARAEAKAAKDAMAKFKAEYGKRFEKVKSALQKYPPRGGAGGGDGADDPVANSAYVKSASALEFQKRDRTIQRLSADLRKERDEVKKKDGALQKYEAFYREVKARSAEKARQRQKAQEEQAQKQRRGQQQQQQKQPQRS